MNILIRNVFLRIRQDALPEGIFMILQTLNAGSAMLLGQRSSICRELALVRCVGGRELFRPHRICLV